MCVVNLLVLFKLLTTSHVISGKYLMLFFLKLTLSLQYLLERAKWEDEFYLCLSLRYLGIKKKVLEL